MDFFEEEKIAALQQANPQPRLPPGYIAADTGLMGYSSKRRYVC